MNAVVATHKAKQAYQSTQVENEDPVGLVVRLYDAMIGSLNRGAESMEVGRVGEAYEAVRLATDVIGQLQATLDLEQGGEIAANLDRLYVYCRREVLEAHVNLEADKLRGVSRLLTPLRDAWSEARTKIQ